MTLPRCAGQYSSWPGGPRSSSSGAGCEAGPFVVAAASGVSVQASPAACAMPNTVVAVTVCPRRPTWREPGRVAVSALRFALGWRGRSCSDSDGSSTSTGAAASRSRLARSIRSCSQSGLGITNGWSAGGAGPDCACRALVAARGGGLRPWPASTRPAHRTPAKFAHSRDYGPTFGQPPAALRQLDRFDRGGLRATALIALTIVGPYGP